MGDDGDSARHVAACKLRKWCPPVLYGAFFQWERPVECPYERGFAGPIGADNSDRFTVGDGEAYAVKDAGSSPGHGDVICP